MESMELHDTFPDDASTMSPTDAPAESQVVVVEDVSFNPDLPNLMKSLRVREGSRQVDQLSALVEQARAIASPRAMYTVAYVDSRDENGAVINGIAFDSRVLSVNLENVHRVFPFVVTCGIELHEWMQGQDDLLVRYYADVISEAALRVAAARLKAHLVGRYALGRTSTMAPGSLADWPIQAQRPLFVLLGDPEATIDVRLTDSLLMIPSKSVSGIRFPVEKTFESCQLCQREKCPSRKAPYEEGLYERRYRLDSDATSAVTT